MIRTAKRRGAVVRRGRPARIDREGIVDAALDLGLGSASIQSIARKLGVTPPALYGHIDSLEEIRGLAAERLLARIQAPRSTSWRTWLRDFAETARRDLTALGPSLGADLRGPLGLQRLSVAEQGLRILIQAGFAPADAGRAIWLVVRAATTAGSEEQASVRRPIDEARRFSNLEGFPAMSRAIGELLRSQAPETFDFDLQVILAGLDSLLRRRHRENRRRDGGPRVRRP